MYRTTSKYKLNQNFVENISAIGCHWYEWFLGGFLLSIYSPVVYIKYLFSNKYNS